MTSETDRAETRELRRAFAAAADVVAAVEPCPPPERLWEGAAGRLDRTATGELVDHLAACPQCAESWRLAIALDSAAADVEPAVPHLQPSAGRAAGLRSWLAAAAAVASVALGLAWIGPDLLSPGGSTGSEEVVYRQAPADAAGSAAIRSALPPRAPLSRERPDLVWSPHEIPGTTYDVLVSTEELELIAEARGLDQPRYRLPDEALRDLPAGARLLWRVVAETPDGEIVRSPTFSTSVGSPLD